jgi:GNAT superfamily N-acetyltransferase
MMDPIIRPAAMGDVPALAALTTHLGYPVNDVAMAARMRHFIADPDYETLVAESGGRVAGYAGVTWKWSYTEDTPRAQLLALVVDPDERGRGTGTALVAAAEAWAREHGAGWIHVTTALHRERTHRFYERLGYAQTGYRYVKSLGGETH